MLDSDRTPPGEGSLPALPTLSVEEMRTLAYASAIGREFDFPLLVAATGQHDEGLAEQLERLVHAGVLRERPGGDRFAFVEDELRARIYQSLTASRLRVLHRKIAEAMERMFPEPSDAIVPELGRHFFLGKVPDRSYRYNRRAATLAIERGQPEEAAHELERARIDLRSLPGDHAAELVEIAVSLGELYFATGDVRMAERLYDEALAQVAPTERRQRARLHLARAEVARERLDAEAARRAAREAHELFSAEGDLIGVASVHRVLGRVAFHLGAYREALDEGIRALDLLQHSGDQRTLGRLCVDIGNAFAMLGPDVASEADDWYKKAIDRLSAAGDWPEVARAYFNLASLIGQERPMDGLEYLAQGEQVAERAHEPRWVGWGLANSIEMRLSLGQVEEAERDNQQAKRLLERSNDALGMHQVGVNGGLIAEKRGQWEDAELAFRAAIDDADRLQLAAESALANFYLARVLYKTRALDASIAAFERAKTLDVAKLNPAYDRAVQELARQLAAARRDRGDGGGATGAAGA